MNKGKVNAMIQKVSQIQVLFTIQSLLPLWRLLR
jgi:hypothetical protein